MIPLTRDMQDCGAAIVTGTSGDNVVPAYLTASVLVQGPEKSEDAIAGLSFEAHRHAENETAGGKCSWLDGSSAQARRIESGGSGDPKTAVGACVRALSDFAHYVECLLRRIGEGAAQVVPDIPNVDAGELSLVAGGTSTVDSVCAVEGEVDEVPSENDDLSVNGRGGQRCTVRTHSTRQNYSS
jgi:hypothetical protein